MPEETSTESSSKTTVEKEEEENWGEASPKETQEAASVTLSEKVRQARFNRWLDIGIAIGYIIVILDVKLWQATPAAQDILSLVTPVVFYLLGIHSGKEKN